MNTLAHNTVRSRFLEARARGLRAKEAAEAMGLTEGAALAAFHVPGEPETGRPPADTPLRVHALKPSWMEGLRRLQACGPLRALTRNESTVHEKTGVYSGLSGQGDIGLVLGPDIDLRLFLRSWAGGLLVIEPGPAQDPRPNTSLQFFDARGVAVHKVFPVKETLPGAWDKVLTAWVDGQGPAPRFDPVRAPAPRRGQTVQDAEALATDWAAMTDTHEFFGLLKKHGVERRAALRCMQGRFTHRLPATAVQALLYDLAFDGQPLMVFVGNAGCIQIHTGTVRRVEPMTLNGKPWLNVLDPGFNLHLREDLIDEVWHVQKPTRDGVVTSLEVLDAEGDSMALFFGVRKPGQPESSAWRQKLHDLCQASTPEGP